MEKAKKILTFVLGAVLVPVLLGVVIGGGYVLIGLISDNSLSTSWDNLQILIENIAPYMPLISIITLVICAIPILISIFKAK